MRSFEMKSLAILTSLASLLVKETFAAPIHGTEFHIVTEEVTVHERPDGTFVTDSPHILGTFTGHGPTATSSASSSVSSTSTPITNVVIPTTFSYSASSSTSAKVSTKPAAATPDPNPPLKEAAAATVDIDAGSGTTASSSSSSSGGKRGIAYNTADYVKSFSGSSQVSWAYNWGSSSDGLSASGIEYVPLLWGLKPSVIDAWSAAASSAIASGSKHLMSFNEPDLSSQSNIGYSDAAAAYMQHMQPFAGKAKLGAPAVTNGAAPMGLAWLKSFLSSCSDCTIDFVCIHWYDSASNVAYFKSYIQDAYTAGGNRPLWITEFQASGTTDQQNEFLKEVLPWLDASDMVDRYAWFMADTAAGGLMSSSSALSTLGNTFKVV